MNESESAEGNIEEAKTIQQEAEDRPRPFHENEPKLTHLLPLGDRLYFA